MKRYSTHARLLMLMAGLVLLLLAPASAEESKRGFSVPKGATTLKLSENLEVSAKNLQPQLGQDGGTVNSLEASGDVLIRFRPSASSGWVLISCGKVRYDVGQDEIRLSGWPAVRHGIQVLRATSAETYVRIRRSAGKWEIKGPHKIQLSLK